MIIESKIMIKASFVQSRKSYKNFIIVSMAIIKLYVIGIKPLSEIKSSYKNSRKQEPEL
jgi:hypothetical protein